VLRIGKVSLLIKTFVCRGKGERKRQVWDAWGIGSVYFVGVFQTDFCSISVAIESYHLENITERFTVPSDLVES